MEKDRESNNFGHKKLPHDDLLLHTRSCKLFMTVIIACGFIITFFLWDYLNSRLIRLNMLSAKISSWRKPTPLLSATWTTTVHRPDCGMFTPKVCCVTKNKECILDSFLSDSKRALSCLLSLNKNDFITRNLICRAWSKTRVGNLRHACHTWYAEQFPAARRSSKFSILLLLRFTQKVYWPWLV